MTFLWPAALGLLALAIPIIAFYLVKSRIPRRQVTTLLFWNQVKPRLIQQPFWRRLRRWLSLALQLLFLLLLVLALTQPQPFWRSAQPERVVYVISASASMRAKDVSPDRWQQARTLIEQRISTMRYFDESAVILASDPARILSGWTTSQRTLMNALEGAETSPGVDDARPALALAENLAASREGGRVVFVSDGVLPYPLEKAPAIAATGKETAPLKKAPILDCVRVGGDEAVNSGITLFSARRSTVAPGEFQIAVRVESNSKEPTEVEFELTRDGRLMDVQKIKLEPGKPWEKSWKDQGNAAVQFTAKLSGMQRDDLVEDNIAAANVNGLYKISVLLVSPKNSFLEALLASLDLVDWKRIEPGHDTPAALAAADLVIYSKCLPLESTRPTGGKPRAVVLMAPVGQGFWGKSGDALDAPLISEWQRESVPLRYVSLDQVRLNHATSYTPAPGAAVLAESFAHPLIFGDWEQTAAPQWLVLGFDLEQSDFVLRTAFPVLLGNVIQSLRPEQQSAFSAVLPGSIGTRLANTLPPEQSGDPAATASKGAAYSLASLASHPAWWWLVLAGLFWLLLEWRLYSRRITE
ncbi:MAG: VWA domain-containing protein [Candidatus Methylacidiphilales bacterium]|nr:VWA domain-containing protein [Candidatus Methylacidiphilales bacterium]